MPISSLNSPAKLTRSELSSESKDQLLALIKAWGRELGFSQIGVASVDLSHAERGLLDWLDAGFHGEMNYMSSHGLKRARPAELVPGTLSVITARMNYLPRSTLADQGQWMLEEQDRLERESEGVVSIYARGRDYHKVLRQRLEHLAVKIQDQIGTLGYRVFTDSAPVLEVELGAQSGLGWRGKHTLLLSRDSGSMFFLGEIYIDLPLTPTPKQDSHCGSCSACIDVCPTGAITSPYVLDARKCISYLTIEHAGPIPLELRALMGNHIYGCDDCQTTCPWNKYAKPSELEDFDVRLEIVPDAPNQSTLNQSAHIQSANNQTPAEKTRAAQAKLTDYFSWTEEEFDQKTRGTAIRRIGHERWLRNVAVAMGNALAKRAQLNFTQSNIGESQKLQDSQSLEIEQALRLRLDHPSPLVVEHVQWALAQKTQGQSSKD